MRAGEGLALQGPQPVSPTIQLADCIPVTLRPSQNFACVSRPKQFMFGGGIGKADSWRARSADAARLDEDGGQNAEAMIRWHTYLQPFGGNADKNSSMSAASSSMVGDTGLEPVTSTV